MIAERLGQIGQLAADYAAGRGSASALGRELGLSAAASAELVRFLGLPVKRGRRANGSGARDADGGPLRRFATIKPAGRGLVLDRGHPALREARTVFPSRVMPGHAVPRLFVGGHNNRKIGKMVTKGALRGLPIYTLTLEERATCPRSCGQWARCFGNNMNWARRVRADADLIARLVPELRQLCAEHPRGILVRAHVLGDFFSLDYVAAWRQALADLPHLHVFGFTAWPPDSDIGRAIALLIRDFPLQLAMRFSGRRADRFSAAVVPTVDAVPAGFLLCPAQTGATDCCATCGLCWQSRQSIAFLEH